MRFFGKISMFLCLAVLLTAVAQAAAVPSGGDCRGTDAAKPIGGSEKLLDTAGAALVYERTTGTLIYAYRADERIYPSSMVKLMTAIVALESCDGSETVTVTRSALDSVAIGSVSAGLQRGEELTVDALLKLMMVGSANDASAVLAEYIGGGQQGFVDKMNAKAQELGCGGTHFTNAHGLHEAENYTTARDILKILEYGLENDTFRTLFETVSCTVPATNKSEAREVVTTNNMMRQERPKYYDKRVTGGKTGATDAAGRCLAVTAQAGDMELIALVMGAQAEYSEDRTEILYHGNYEEMAALLDAMEEKFECRQLFYKDQVISRYPVAEGRNDAVGVCVEDGFCVLPKEAPVEELRWNQTSAALTAPVPAGQQVGTLEIWLGDICLSRTELLSLNPVEVYEPYRLPQWAVDDRQEQRHGEVLAMFLVTALALVLAALGAAVLIRTVRRAVLRVRLRRRRRNRRRNRNARME